MVLKPLYFVSDAGYIHHITSSCLLLLVVLAYYHCCITIITDTPVSLYKGGEMVIIELVSLHGQLSIRLLLVFQAQFQASSAELGQFCTIISL